MTNPTTNHLRASSHGSQVPLMLAHPNMKAESQLVSLHKPLKYFSLSLKLDLDYLMQNISRTWVEN